MREKRLELEEDLKGHSKEIEKINQDIDRARQRAALGGNESVEREVSLLERRRLAYEEKSKLFNDQISEVTENIKAISDTREQAKIELENIKKQQAAAVETSETKPPASEDVKPETKPTSEIPEIKPTSNIGGEAMTESEGIFKSILKKFKTPAGAAALSEALPALAELPLILS